MGRKSILVLACFILGVYAATIYLGLKHFHPSTWGDSRQLVVWQAWQLSSLPAIPPGARGDSVRYGRLLFTQTALFAPTYASANVTCSNCHLAEGTAPYASPMVGLPALFPMFNARAGHMISLKDRIEECFTRSENGRPLPYDSREMTALVDYIHWLSQPEPQNKAFTGRGLVSLPDLKPDPTNGASIYASQCAGCHSTNGTGRPPLMPPLWGDKSFNDGAGMNGVPKMAAFVQHNMPQNRTGTLSPQEAYDVAAYVHSMPRPKFNQAYKKY